MASALVGRRAVGQNVTAAVGSGCGSVGGGGGTAVYRNLHDRGFWCCRIGSDSRRSSSSSSSRNSRIRNRRGSARLFSTAAVRQADFTHAVVGGGVVGLAIARRLQQREGTSTVLLERHGSVGTETSSRNSEVIHAGLYYGPTSLKTKLCLRGKELLYSLCSRHEIPHRNCGKWIVAQDEQQRTALDEVHRFAESINVPTRFLSDEEARRREPDVRARKGVLESTSTGIVDSHALMMHLLGEFEDAGGLVALHSPVTAIEPLDAGHGGWKISTAVTEGKEHESDNDANSITAETLINSAGLAAISISNMILPPSRHREAFYAKGSYFSYSASHPRASTLIYPAPKPGLAGLGTHLTLDMSGRIRFGPDVEWITDPTDLSVNSSRLPDALREIEEYFPGIDSDAIGLDYAGVRPKLGKGGAVVSKGGQFLDFYIEKEEGFEGFVNLLGIESPGLTSSLAIAEEVERLLYA